MDATPTLVTLSWEPPEAIHINGIIIHYVVRVREVYTGRVFTLRAEEATIQVGPLHPFYIYECQVAAFTVGQGPFGLPFTAQAGETGELHPCLMFRCIMWLIALNRADCSTSEHLICVEKCQ